MEFLFHIQYEISSSIFKCLPFNGCQTVLLYTTNCTYYLLKHPWYVKWVPTHQQYGRLIQIYHSIAWSMLGHEDITLWPINRQERSGIASPSSFLIHWGRATHICFSKLTMIDSDNGLAPSRRQAIIWTNAGMLSIFIASMTIFDKNQHHPWIIVFRNQKLSLWERSEMRTSPNHKQRTNGQWLKFEKMELS